MSEVICTDNRFELIAKYKAKLIEATNIETSADEMAVIDNILFRVWQMGWLDRLEQPTVDAVPVVHGKWIWDEMLGEYRCSECDRITRDTHDEIKVWEGRKVFALVLPYYCGFCGAKMDGKEQSDG